MAWNFELIERKFADAAENSNLWNEAMDAIAAETESVGTILLPPPEVVIPNAPSSEAIQRCVETYFKDGWHARDERFRGWHKMVQRGVADDFDIISHDHMKRHAYYQEFLRPHGLQYFAAVKMAAGDDLWCVSIQRSIQQGPFSKAEMRKLAALSKKLASAGAVARALGFAATNASVETFELSGSAVMLLNRRGNILRLNRAAEALLGQDLKVSKSRIASYDQNATDALDRALHLLLWSNTNSALMPPVPLPRRDRRPILAYPLKLSAVSVNIFSECQAIVVFVDLERRARPPQEALKSVFSLSPAETRLAFQISSGASLEMIADRLQLSKETARTQLKAIFQKTGVQRQAELVALLASFIRQ